VRQRVTVPLAERVGAELAGVGDGREVDNLPAATVLESPVLLQPAPREVVRVPAPLDRDHRVAVRLQPLQRGRRPPVVHLFLNLLRLGLGPVLVRVVHDEQVHGEASQARTERHRADAAALVRVVVLRRL
jgi:hypothetical protein